MTCGEESPLELSTNQVKSLIDEIINIGVSKVTILGGEPLIRPDIFEILSYLEDRGLECGIVTNGLLLSELNIQRLLELNSRMISVSLDGGSARVNDSIRGSGSFQRTIDGIIRVIQAGIRVNIITTVSRMNYRDIENICALGEYLGVDHVTFSRLFPYGRAADSSSEFLLTPFEMRSVYRGLIKLKKKYSDFVGVSIPQCNFMKTKTMPDSSCGAGRTTFSIDAEGGILPCSFLPMLRCGSIQDSSLSEIWCESLMLQEFRRKTLPKTRGIGYQCESCKHFSYCTKGCIAAALIHYSDITAPDPICWHYSAGLNPTSLLHYLIRHVYDIRDYCIDHWS